MGAVVSLLTGVFSFMAGRRKSNADAMKATAEAEVTLVGGFKDLISEFRLERTEMLKRIENLEFDRMVLEGRVDQLELVLHKHNIDIPPIVET